MTNRLETPKRQIPRISWITLAIVGILTALSALFVAVTPAGSQTTLAAGSWETFAAEAPEVAGLFEMQLVLVGVSFMAFSVFGTLVTLVPFRRGETWAWMALWLFPLVFAAVVLRMLSDQYAVGYYYLLLFAISLIALVLPIRRYL